MRNRISEINREHIKPFYNKHLGETCVVMGTGNTLNQYTPIDNAIHIGVNSAIHFKKLNLDYLFVMDYSPVDIHKTSPTIFSGDVTAFQNYVPKIQKFYGQSFGEPSGLVNNFLHTQGIPRNMFDRHAKPFEIIDFRASIDMKKDVGEYCFGNSFSTIFVALQFALFTGCKRIVLVGVDCYGSNFVLDRHIQVDNSKLIQTWKYVKEWMKREYPDVIVEVIRPIGLRDVFPIKE